MFIESGGNLSKGGLVRQKVRVPKNMAFAQRMVGFFDGASQELSSLCGVGAILYLEYYRNYQLWLNCSPGTNTKGELLSLWILLRLAEFLGMDGIQIFGDSKINIDWDIGIHHIYSAYLSPWIRQVKVLIDSFQDLVFAHIFQEHNSLVDGL